MKRGLMFILLIMVTALVFAGFDYKLELLSFKPTYTENSAERNRAALDFQYVDVYKGYPTEFYQNENKFVFNDPGAWRVKPFFAVFHLGETLDLLRNTFYFDSFLSPISISISVQGSLTQVMEGEVADTIGYDGLYFYGIAASFADVVSAKFGYNHYCSHYGDGTYKYLERGETVTPGFSEWYKYLRMDSLQFGLSVTPIEYARVYGEVIFDMPSTYVMPEIFSPAWTKRGARADDVPLSYNHLIVALGTEVEYPVFKNLGMTKFSYQMKAYEEGKIVYKEEDLAAAGRTKAFYDPDRPWEFEHTFNLSQEINDFVSFDITWHLGRFMANMYYSTRSHFISIGGRLNFDGTVTLFDSAK